MIYLFWQHQLLVCSSLEHRFNSFNWKASLPCFFQGVDVVQIHLKERLLIVCNIINAERSDKCLLVRVNENLNLFVGVGMKLIQRVHAYC